jgi:hypothetical protein
MWLTAELLLSLWVLLGGWWLWRRGPARCLSTGVGMLLVYGSAVLAAWLAGLVFDALDTNRWLQLLATCLLGTIALIVAARWWRPHDERLCAYWTTALVGRWRGRAVQTAVLTGWLAVHLVSWVLLANLVVSAHPAAAAVARACSLFTAHLLGTPAGTAWEQSLAEQQERMHGLGLGVDSLLDATGTRQVMELMDAIGWISRLEGDERARLVAASPELGRLTHEPALLAVIDDPRLMGLVDEAIHGSLPATYALGSEPAVIALIDSQAMRAAIRAVDPVVLRRQAAQTGDGLVATWQLAAIASSLELDRQLASPGGWTSVTGTTLTWETQVRFGVARSSLPAGDPRTLVIASAADCSCWFADHLLRPRRHGGQLEVGLPATAGELILLFDFAGIAPPRLVNLSLRVLSP